MKNIYYIHILIIIQFVFNISLEDQKYSKEYNNLYNYIVSNGGYINPKLIPNENSKTNRYIMTSQKISKNEKILYIPDKLSISQIHKLVFKKCFEAYGPEDGNDFNCLAYFMTIDNYNSSSLFKPYYDYLPLINNSDFIFDFTPKEIELYKDIGITKGINNYNKYYSQALDPVKHKLKLFSEKKGIKYEDILKNFKYNFDLVATRNFGRPGSYYDHSTMVPYLDLINHSDKNNTFWYYEDLDAGYSLIAGRDIDPNEEITDSYGPYHNSYLYTKYGFVIPGNIYHEYLDINLYGENYTLHEEYLNSIIDTIFYKLNKINELDKNEIKKYVVKNLEKKLEYYLDVKVKCQRYNLKVIIDEHIDIINKTIKKIKEYK